jgi:hypothetical protein
MGFRIDNLFNFFYMIVTVSKKYFSIAVSIKKISQYCDMIYF